MWKILGGHHEIAAKLLKHFKDFLSKCVCNQRRTGPIECKTLQKLYKYFAHKGRIRFRIWVRNDFFGSGSVSDLAKKVTHPTGFGAVSTTLRNWRTIKLDEDFTRYYRLCTAQHC
jgi:hypothetical protein